MNSKKYYVYILLDPITYEICYVGISNNPNKRLQDHIKSKDDETHLIKSAWIDSLMRLGQKPRSIILESSEDSSYIRNAEYSYICKFRDQGHPLINLSPKIKFDNYIELIRSSRWARERSIDVYSVWMQS